MTRLHELITDVKNSYPNDDFFASFEQDYEEISVRRQYFQVYIDVLTILDNESWEILKGKAIKKFLNHREGQRKQGFFNILNEAFAYRFLIKEGFEDVRFMLEEKKKKNKEKSPDISFKFHDAESYCEVKTLCISNDEIKRREKWTPNNVQDFSVYLSLTDGFFNNFHDIFIKAKNQINSNRTDGLVYIIIRFDDLFGHHIDNYRDQLINFCGTQGYNNLVIKPGLFEEEILLISSNYK